MKMMMMMMDFYLATRRLKWVSACMLAGPLKEPLGPGLRLTQRTYHHTLKWPIALKLARRFSRRLSISATGSMHYCPRQHRNFCVKWTASKFEGSPLKNNMSIVLLRETLKRRTHHRVDFHGCCWFFFMIRVDTPLTVYTFDVTNPKNGFATPRYDPYFIMIHYWASRRYHFPFSSGSFHHRHNLVYL